MNSVNKAFESKSNEIKIYFAYVILFALFVFKMFFYAYEGFPIPDQEAQMSYIIYMEQNPDVIIPVFEDISAYDVKEKIVDGNTVYYEMEWTEEHCYLGHPPLYYKMMQLCNTVDIADDGTVYINFTQLSNCNIILTSITMIIALMAGYKLISQKTNSWHYHLLYAAICTTLPLYGYIGSGPNNDNLCNLGMVIFWLGLISYCEKRYCYKTFWLVALGICICMFAKLTSGLIVLIATVIVIVFDIVRTKKLGIVLNKYFPTTLPLYLIVLGYFVSIYVQYGTFQPSYGQFVSAEEYTASQFYVAEEHRVILSFEDHFKHFFSGIWQTWTATYETNYMLVRNGWVSFGYFVVMVVFILCIVIGIKKMTKNAEEKNEIINVAMGIAMFCTLMYHYWTNYNGHKAGGYMGGYQARYYMPCIPIVAIGVVKFLQSIKMKRTPTYVLIESIVAIVLSMLLIYSDIGYFIMNIYYTGVELL